MRRVLAALAVVGMLVHALAIVRHTVVVVDQAGARLQLAANLRILCSGHHLEVELPASPQAPGDCPICTGLVGATAILPPDVPTLTVYSDARSTRHRVVAMRLAERGSDVLPPPRGPPHIG